METSTPPIESPEVALRISAFSADGTGTSTCTASASAAACAGLSRSMIAYASSSSCCQRPASASPSRSGGSAGLNVRYGSMSSSWTANSRSAAQDRSVRIAHQSGVSTAPGSRTSTTCRPTRDRSLPPYTLAAASPNSGVPRTRAIPRPGTMTRPARCGTATLISRPARAATASTIPKTCPTSTQSGTGPVSITRIRRRQCAIHMPVCGSRKMRSNSSGARS
jgi:hypothetical protein